MFSGPYLHPRFNGGDGILTWDLHESHGNGDFGYSWEMDGTIYPTSIVKPVVEESRARTPNLLEAEGGGRWSKMTRKHQMSCFELSKLVVPTVNVVQNNFQNPVIGKTVGTEFLLEAWNSGMRLDIGRYVGMQNECIHIKDLHLTNL
jgi:hypothetical protein